MRVRNKVIVVTGGGSGIGRALVLHLLAKGARVAAVDLNPAALRETAQLAGAQASRLSTHELNITDRTAVAALPAQVVAAHGAVDGLINNAGIIQPFVRVPDLDEATIERVMNVNFYGTVWMTKAFFAPPAGPARSAYCERFEHGRLFAGAGTNHLRRSQSSGEALY